MYFKTKNENKKQKDKKLSSKRFKRNSICKNKFAKFANLNLSHVHDKTPDRN